MGTDMTNTNIANQKSRQSIERKEDFEQFAKYLGLDYDDYIAFKGEDGVKNAGKLRLEGKEYITQDGDVFHFRFNN